MRTEPTVNSLDLMLLSAQMSQGHFDDARRTIALLEQRAPASPLTLWGRSYSLAAMGDYDGAERAYIDFGLKVRDPGYQSTVHGSLAGLAQTRGKLAEAEQGSKGGINGGQAGDESLSRAEEVVGYLHAQRKLASRSCSNIFWFFCS